MAWVVGEYWPGSLGEERPHGGTGYREIFYWNQVSF